MLCLSTKLFLFGELGTDMWDYLHNERIANTEFVQKNIIILPATKHVSDF